MKKLLLLTFLTVLIFTGGCFRDDSSGSSAAGTGAGEINLNASGSVSPAVVDNSNKTISIQVSPGTDLTSLGQILLV